MKINYLSLVVFLWALAACTPDDKSTETAVDDSLAHFEWFEYSGDDEVFNLPITDNEYRNPILAGYYPDPSVVRVGIDYYMVNSTFGFFPGIPVFHSRDLVNWTQIGNAIHRPEQLPFDGIHLGQNGVYAPAIEHRDGVFYVINTCVACGGNFVVTASDPAGPWSDPIWIPHIKGIDPSIFFDDDGKTYVVHHGDPKNKRGFEHTALFVMQVDPVTFEALSEDVMLVDGGEEAPWHTEWIEGPHLYKVNGTYYLSAPGGGTGYYHGQLLYRSKNVFGPFEANPNNPVLTQLGLPDDRKHPLTSTGHGDMFTDANGDWWIVFLGTRVYDLHIPPQDPGLFHTGRETFMLPVTWKDGWPYVLKNEPVPYVVKKPNLPTAKHIGRPMTGNYTLRESFIQTKLAPHWLMIRAPHSQWWNFDGEKLNLQPRAEKVGDKKQPSFIGRRLAHMKASFGTKMQFNPQSQQYEAGLLAVQNDGHYYTLGLSQNQTGDTVIRIRKRAGEDDPPRGKTLIETAIELQPGSPVYLKMDIDKAELDFSYSLDGKRYTLILDNTDARVLTTAMAGGFTGAVVGMYAEGEDLH